MQQDDVWEKGGEMSHLIKKENLHSSSDNQQVN